MKKSQNGMINILESKSMNNLAKMVKNIAKNMGDKVEKFFKERNIANC